MQQAADVDPATNRQVVGAASHDADLVVWPEAMARDFGEAGSDVSPYAESLDGAFVEAFAANAGEATVVAGMFERSDDPRRPFNTLVATTKEQLVGSYRKIHLYDSFGFKESDVLSKGDLDPQVIDVDGWQVGLMTCYDLRFPELARALVDQGAEVLLVPAAWVAGPRKIDHWRTLLMARAIENVAYVVAVGQPAPRYCGHSMLIDPMGEVVVEAPAEGDAVLDAVLQREVLDTARERNPSLSNRRMRPGC